MQQQQTNKNLPNQNSVPNSPTKTSSYQPHYPQPSKQQVLNNSSTIRSHTYDYPPVTGDEETHSPTYKPNSQQNSYSSSSQQQNDKKQKGLTGSGVSNVYIQNLQQSQTQGKPQQTAVSRQFTSAAQQNENHQNGNAQSVQKSSLRAPVQREMEEQLPHGQLANAYSNTSGQFQDENGQLVNYRRELTHASDPNKDSQLLTQQEQRIVDEPSEDHRIINRY